MFFHSKKQKRKDQILSLIICFMVMLVGIVTLKFIPERLFGADITFDASLHVTATIFILYTLYFFVDQNIVWRYIYVVGGIVLTAVIAIERIVAGAHDSYGVMLALGISLGGIILSRWSFFKKRLTF